MKVTVISHNLSTNALGRSYILAKALMMNYEVEFVGVVGDVGIWPPCDTGEFSYKAVKKGNFIRNVIELYSLATGDVVYAVKPLPASFGVGLLCKFFKNKPLVLDIDDWELGFNIQDYKDGKISFLKFARVYLTLGVLERLVNLADKITTVSTFLNQKFGGGGTFVPHGRDVEKFDPKKYDAGLVKKDLGLENKKVIMFLGSVKPHKGLDDLLDAARLASKEVKNLRVVLVGVDFQDLWTKGLLEENKDLITTVGFVKFDEIPKYLVAADVVVLPQKDTPETKGQIPAKIFDAMAMEKPIISTRVSDIEIVLKNCGLVVEPSGINQLSRALIFMFKNPEKAKQMGLKAREKCINNYSLEVMEGQLKSVFGSLGG